MKHKKKKPKLKMVFNIEGEPVTVSEMKFKEWLKNSNKSKE